MKRRVPAILAASALALGAVQATAPAASAAKARRYPASGSGLRTPTKSCRVASVGGKKVYFVNVRPPLYLPFNLFQELERP